MLFQTRKGEIGIKILRGISLSILMVLFLTAGVTYAQSPAKYEKGGGVQEVVTNNKLERNF